MNSLVKGHKSNQRMDLKHEISHATFTDLNPHSIVLILSETSNINYFFC
jgi:hypothetical protein